MFWLKSPRFSFASVLDSVFASLASRVWIRPS